MADEMHYPARRWSRKQQFVLDAGVKIRKLKGQYRQILNAMHGKEQFTSDPGHAKILSNYRK